MYDNVLAHYTTLRRRLPGAPVLALGLAVALGGSGCGDLKPRASRGSLPVKGDLGAILAAQDEASLARYSEEQGVIGIRNAYHAIEATLAGGSENEVLAARDRALPSLRLLADRMARDYCAHNYVADADLVARLTPPELLRRSRLVARRDSVVNAAGLPLEQKLAASSEILDGFVGLGDERWVLVAEQDLAWMYEHLGNPAMQNRLLSTHLERARALGATATVCHQLGTIGWELRSDGDVDSMFACWNDLERLARECRLPMQAARAHLFRALHYERVGRLALAAHHLEESIAVCHELRGQYSELRFLGRAMEFHSGLGSWNELERHLLRARFLMARHREGPPARELQWLRLLEARLALWEADRHFADGNVARADSTFRAIVPFLKKEPSQGLYFETMRTWSESLVSCGRYEEALEVCRAALVDSRARHRVTDERSYLLTAARAAVALGRSADAESSLARYDALVPVDRPRERFRRLAERDLVRARLAKARGDTEEWRDALAGVLEDLVRDLERFDSTEHAYLFVDSFEELHLALHEAVSDPARGAHLEMAWRTLFSLSRGQDSRWILDNRERALSRILTLVRGADPPGLRAGYPPGGEHWLYLVAGDEVRRWVASASGVRCDTLRISARDLRHAVRRACRLLARDDCSPAEQRDLRTELAALGSHLLPLPLEVSAGRVLITVDGCLGSIPLEVLDTDPGLAYRPLLAELDVAYVRYDGGDAGRRRASGPAVVVVDPEIPPELTRRYPALVPLDHAREEARQAAQRLGETVTLSGADATKDRLLALWEQAPAIYVAAHLLRNPDTPYVSFLPLAHPSRTAAPAEAFLEARDILGANLSGCRLVVLSSCSSGAPYVSQASGPGLGDVFLDSGARSVVHTLWDVDDASAGRLMADFLDRHERSGDVVSALSAARREAAAGGEPPSVWAAYVVQLGMRPSSSTARATSAHPR